MLIERRKFLIGSLATLFAAPAIVRAGSLMPVKLVVSDNLTYKTAAAIWSGNKRYDYRWRVYDVELGMFVGGDDLTIKWDVSKPDGDGLIVIVRSEGMQP
jgi:hypothetical protein